MIKEIYEKRNDITFLMEETEKELPCGLRELRQKVVGWYYGYPNKIDTEIFTGKLEAVCQFELED